MANQPDWLTPRSGAIPIMIEDEDIKVVLVTTKPKSNNNWIFPKGQVELGMTAYDSAAKEAFEEAGVIGQISPTLFDKYQHKKWGGNMGVKVYILEVTKILDTWDEMHDRNRQVVSLDEAIELVQSEQQQTLIRFKQWMKKLLP